MFPAVRHTQSVRRDGKITFVSMNRQGNPDGLKKDARFESTMPSETSADEWQLLVVEHVPDWHPGVQDTSWVRVLICGQAGGCWVGG